MAGRGDVRDKRFPITHPDRARDHGVDASPMLDHFTAAGVRVLDDAAAQSLSLHDFDYV